jgi:hypothetical protein
MGRKLGGPQSRYGRGGEEKSSQFLQGLEPPIIQSVPQRYIIELSRSLPSQIPLPYPASFAKVLHLII